VTPEIALSVRETYDAYLAAFHTHRAHAVLPYLHVPLITVASGEVIVISTTEDIESMYAGILEALAGVNYSHTVMASQDVIVLDDTMALMTVVGTRYDRGGQPLERIAAVYTLVRRDDTWRITVMMPFAPQD
jgi:uncharacterized NTF2-like protein DUF6841